MTGSHIYTGKRDTEHRRRTKPNSPNKPSKLDSTYTGYLDATLVDGGFLEVVGEMINNFEPAVSSLFTEYPATGSLGKIRLLTSSI